MARHKSYPVEPSPTKLRMIAAGFIPSMLLFAGFLVYLSWTEIDLFHDGLMRGAPVIETPLSAIIMLPMLLISILAIPAISIAAWTGKQFNPKEGSFLDTFQNVMLKATVYSCLSIIPGVIILSTLFSSYSDYFHCPELRKPGTRGPSLWVNNENLCFKPDHYINHNWPCKKIDDKELCIQLDAWKAPAPVLK